MAKSTDETVRLLAEAHAGSREALGQALEVHRGYLLIIAQRELDPDLNAKGGASDLVQETFLEAQRGFMGFHGRSEDELRAWLRQVLLNNLANFVRRFRDSEKRQLAREVSMPPGGTSLDLHAAFKAPGPSPSGEAMDHEQAAVLRKALARLPDDYRQVVQLRYQEERTFEEIGRLMNRTANAVRKLWLRAVERLQQELEAPP